MSITFPRPYDRKGHAWGLQGAHPKAVWERFSPAYEAQLERIVCALEQQGFEVAIEGAGGQDGEYVHAAHIDGRILFQHLEDPTEARKLAATDDDMLATWLDELTREAD